MLTLMYHNILSSTTDSMPSNLRAQVTLEQFRQQMEALHRSVIHPLDADQQLRHGKEPRGILITFDDGGVGLLAASAILAEFNLTAVAFICPGAFRRHLWFYRLAHALAATREPSLIWRQDRLPLQMPGERDQAYYRLVDEFGPMPSAERDCQLDHLTLDLLKVMDAGAREYYGALDEEELHQAARSGHLIFANHTWSHPDLDKIPLDEARREIEMADEWLSQADLVCLDWLAFPRGKYNDAVVRIAQETSVAVFGADASEPHPQVRPRVGIYGIDDHPLRFWLKVHTPLAAMVRKGARLRHFAAL